MAVIKIVPMPGAEGQKGDPGATGAQGPQGPIGATGPAGADALWSYNGEWQSNATYAEGDLVTHDGQLYYATGITTLGITPDLDSNFDLVAAKGADGEILQTDSISGTWDPQFYELNNIIPRLDGSLGHPLGPQSDYPLIANYYTIGDMVFFNFNVYLFDAIQWGAPNEYGFYLQYRFNLPFKHSMTEWTYSPLSNAAQSNPLYTTYRTGSPAPFIGRLVVRNDMEPAGYGDNENFVIPVYGSMNLNNETQQSYVAISSMDTEGLTDVNAGVFKAVTSIWPVDLISPSATPNSKLLRLHVAGTYRKEPTDIATEIDQYIQGPQGIQGIQGPQGEPGIQGEQGIQGIPGTNGADALWNFVGEYDNGADYWPGDVVTFAGGTYYRIGEPNPGYYPTDPTYWTTIATPGATGPQGPQGDPGPAGSFVYKSGTVPATHHGVAGDTKNDIKYDNTHVYICVADYTDGSAAIWKRINWASGNW